MVHPRLYYSLTVKIHTIEEDETVDASLEVTASVGIYSSRPFYSVTCLCMYVWGESKLAKRGGSGSLAPHSVNSEDVTAEIICSTAHGCQEVLAWLGYFVQDACMSAT